MLATIRRDAPINFVLPEKSWQERVEIEDTLSLFSELGFRTLAARIRQVLSVPSEHSLEVAAAAISSEELSRAQIMLWLLSSDRTNATYEDILDYGRTYLDSETWEDTIKALGHAIEDEGLATLFAEIEMPLSQVIAEMNQAGITLDTKYLGTLSTKLHTELTALEKSIHTHVGEEFNLNSPKQLGEALFDTLGLKPKNQKKTATGQRSTKESELEKMREEHPVIADILRYRELQKLVSTYIDNLPDMVSEDGRLRSTFLQTGTTTGRMASKDPNLQNIPIRTKEGKDVRKAFIAAPGHTLVSIDYSQIELRIAAILSEDVRLSEIFKTGQDVHQGVASQVFSVPADEVTSDMRRQAKVINFGILYGMGVNALRSNLGEGTTREAAQEFLNAYFNTFTRLAEYLEETKAYARTN
ncbi:MAG: DNA polymerase, partial [Bacteroidota bacterium]